MKQLTVHRGRTMVIPVSLGYDVSGDTFVSEVRDRPESSAILLASWDISFLTDGIDGELVLTMDDSVTTDVADNVGYMDLKRISGGEPLSVFNEPIQVLFTDAVTI